MTAGQVAPPRVRAAEFADFAAIHRLESTFWPDSLLPDDRRRLFTDNPLWSRLAGNWPVGWVLEDASGRIVGSVTNIPSSYRLDGEELICGNGHCWWALPEYRGYAAVLMDEYFGQERADVLVSAKVGATATPLWAGYANRVPLGDWRTTAYVVTRYLGFARTALRMKGVPFAAALAPVGAGVLRLRDAFRSTERLDGPRSVEFAESDGFDGRFDAFWRELQEQSPKTLLGTRDSATLRWHYAVPMRARRIFVLTACRNGRMLAYCVLKKHFRTNGVRSLKLVDFQTVDEEANLLPGLLRLALRRCAAENCYVLEHLGCGLEKWRHFDRLAPHRAVKPAWPFYYHTADAALAATLADPQVWDPSEYDGDSSYI